MRPFPRWGASLVWLCILLAGCGKPVPSGSIQPSSPPAGGPAAGESSHAPPAVAAAAAPAAVPSAGGESPQEERATLLVKVVMDADGSPVPGAMVRLLWKQSETEVGRATNQTDAQGVCLYTVRAGVLLQSLVVEPSVMTAPAALAIKEPIAGGQTAEYELRLKPGGFVQGWVRDMNAQPVAGAEVRIWFKGRWDVEQDEGPVPPADLLGESDEQGLFTLGGMPEGAFILEAFAEGMATVQRAGGKLKPAQVVDDLEIQLAPAHPAYGQVKGPQGESIPDALVVAGAVGRHAKREPSHVEGVWYYPSRQYVLRSDADGSFVIPLVPQHEVWALEVRHQDYQSARERLLPGQAALDVILEAGYRLGGRVLDQDGRPLRGAYLRLFGEQEKSKRSDAAGDFLFNGLSADPEAALLVYAPGHAVQALWPLRIERDAGELEIRLQPGATLSGLVVDRDGQPLAGATVRVTGAAPSSPQAAAPFPAPLPELEFGLASTQTAADGRFTLLDLYPGSFTVVVTPPPGRGAERSYSARTGEEIKCVVE